jgi:hypothetical protein
MGFGHLFRHANHLTRSQRPRRGRPVPLCAEELEPRTLLSADIAHPLHEILLAPPAGLGDRLPGHPPTSPRGPGAASPAYDPNQSPGGYWPAQIRHGYGFDNLTLDGTGQTIAIVDAYHDPNMASDLAVFDSQFHLPAPPSFRQVNETGGSASGVPVDSSGDWEVEEALDVEWAHAIAPGASILLVEADAPTYTDLLTAVDTARGTSGVVAVSMSWGGPEDPSELSADSTFTTPAGHIGGVTFVAASGDSGAGAGFPAVSPNVLAIGGTSLALNATDNRTSETGWNGSGGGYSAFEGEPGYQNTYAHSSYVQNTLHNNVLLNTHRGNPDVSYDADPAPGVAVYDSYLAPGWLAVGGTSAAAPQWSALLALVAQGRGAAGSLDGVSQTLPNLYQLAANPTSYGNDFLDITAGNNGFSAGVGYDLVTGLGSPRPAHLVPDLINGATGPAGFQITASPANPVAGAQFSITVTAQDVTGHTVTGYTGTVHFTTTDTGTGVVLPPNYTFTAADHGVHTFTNEVTLVTAGARSITATDTSSSSLTGQTSVTVSPAAASSLVVVAPSGALATSPFTVTVTAKDPFGNTVTGYRGTVQFTTSDSGTGVALPQNYTFGAGDNGTHSFTNGVTLVTLGTQTVTATDTTASSITGFASVNVTPDQVTHFTVTAPSGATAGTAFSVTVSALDANNHVVSGYRGTVRFTTSDSGNGIALPQNYTFNAADAGTHTFTNGVTLVTAGAQVVTATDTSSSSITGQASVTVSPAAASTLVVGAPSSISTGTPFTLTATAKDPFGNTATGYRGTVHITSTDTAGGVQLPGDYTFAAGDNGTHSFANGVTLVTLGTQTVTATDRSTASITGFASVTVTPAQATHFSVSAAAGATAGSPFDVTVTALDANNHVVSGYLGTVHFTTTDTGTGVVLPGDYTFTAADAGAHTFAAGVTLITAAPESVTARDTSNGSISGFASVLVSPAAASTLVVSAPSTVVSGSPFNLTVTAMDRFGNVATGYLGTVQFTTSDTDPGVVLPPNYTFTAADAGTHTFPAGATLITVGPQTVTATDTVNGSITGSASVNVAQTQSGNNLIVNPGFETGDFTGWSISPAPDSSYFGVAFAGAHSGNFAAYFGSYGFERDDIYQNVPTVPGHTYLISYWIANGGGGSTEIRSSWGGTVLEDLFPNNAFPYEQHTFTAVATSTSTQFRIGGYQLPSFWYLDDVSVTDISAPGPSLVSHPNGGTGPSLYHPGHPGGHPALLSGPTGGGGLAGTRLGRGTHSAAAAPGTSVITISTPVGSFAVTHAGAGQTALDAVMTALGQNQANFRPGVDDLLNNLAVMVLGTHRSDRNGLTDFGGPLI